MEKLRKITDYAAVIPKQRLTIHFTNKLLYNDLNLFGKIDD